MTRDNAKLFKRLQDTRENTTRLKYQNVRANSKTRVNRDEWSVKINKGGEKESLSMFRSTAEVRLLSHAYTFEFMYLVQVFVEWHGLLFHQRQFTLVRSHVHVIADGTPNLLKTK